MFVQLLNMEVQKVQSAEIFLFPLISTGMFSDTLVISNSVSSEVRQITPLSDKEVLGFYLCM